MFTPVPCSAFSEPSYLSTTSATRSLHEGVVALAVLGSARSGVSMKCRFPAEACPATPGRKPCLPSSACRSRRRLGDPLRRDAHVLEDQRRARRPQLPDQPEEPLAHGPGASRPSSLVAREVGRRGAARGRRASPRRRATRGVELGVVVGAELHQQRRRVGRQLLPVLGRAGHVRSAAAISAGATISSTARAPAATSVGDRRRRRVDAREVEPRDRRVAAAAGTVLEHGLGDERERALGADEQPAEDLERRVRVEERAEPVAGRVLDLELAARRARPARRRRAARRGSRAGRARAPARPRRSAPRRPGAAVSIAVPEGSTKRQRGDGPVGVLVDAAAHAARVVGDHAADGRDVRAAPGRGRACGRAAQHAVRVAEQRARLHARTRAAVLARATPGPVPADVHEDAVGLALAVEARAAAAEGDGVPVAAGVREDLARRRRRRAPSPPPAGTCGTGWRRRRSGRGRSPGRARGPPRAAPRRSAAQRLRRAAGEAVGHAVRGRLGHRAPDAPRSGASRGTRGGFYSIRMP